jgi:hypothetical protein
MHIYEYLFAALIIVTMIVASLFMVTTVTEPQKKISEREQLKITAEKIMNQILFDPGYPNDWGSNLAVQFQTIQSFGLAKFNETTRGAFTLDADKILRLSNETNANRELKALIPNLLNLGSDYGIAMEFTTPLIVDISDRIDANTYDISVTSHLGGLPAYGAKATGRMYYVNNDQIIQTPEITASTDPSGNCIIDFSGFVSELVQEKALVVSIDYNNIHVTQAFTNRSVPMLGSQIYSNQPLDQTVCQALVVNEDGAYKIKSVNTMITGQPLSGYELAYNEPSAVATFAKDGSNGLVCATKKIWNAGYCSASIDFHQISNPLSYTIERTVTIEGLRYLMRLYVWRTNY